MSDDDSAILERYFAGGMDAEEETALHARLRESEDFLRRFTEFVVFDEMLREGSATVLHPVNRPVTARRRQLSRSTRVFRLRRRSAIWPAALVAAALVVIGISLLLTGMTDNEGPEVVAIAGPAVLIAEGRERALRRGDVLADGTRVRTGPAGRISLRYRDGSLVMIQGSTDLGVGGPLGKRLILDHGALHGEIAAQPPGRPLVMTTPLATATVLGTVLDLDSDMVRTALMVAHGRVELRRTADAVRASVGDGQSADTADMIVRPWPPVPARAVVMPLMEAETLSGASEADAQVHAGRVVRPYREVLAEASGGVCLALPGIGTELVIPAPDQPGSWWLWVRYRDEEHRTAPLPAFTIAVDHQPRMEITAPGGSQAWLWARCPVVVRDGIRIVIRSSVAGTLDTTNDAHAYRSVNRIDALRFTSDPAFDPRREPTAR